MPWLVSARAGGAPRPVLLARVVVVPLLLSLEGQCALPACHTAESRSLGCTLVARAAVVPLPAVLEERGSKALLGGVTAVPRLALAARVFVVPRLMSLEGRCVRPER